MELWNAECCSPTDNCGNGDNSLTRRRMNDNKQPRELSLSQSHTMGPSVYSDSFQKHTVPVQTTMTTAYTHDHTQVSVQDEALKEHKERCRLRVTLFGPLVYAVTIGGVTMSRLQNTHSHTYCVTTIRVFNHPSYLKLHFGPE